MPYVYPNSAIPADKRLSAEEVQTMFTARIPHSSGQTLLPTGLLNQETVSTLEDSYHGSDDYFLMGGEKDDKSEKNSETSSSIQATEVLFQVGDTYDNIEKLKKELDDYAAKNEFKVRSGSRIFHYWRGYHTPYDSTRTRNKGLRNRKTPMKCNCDWKVHNSKNKEILIEITQVSLNHTNGCFPSSKELLCFLPKSTKPKELYPKFFSELLCWRKTLNSRLSTKIIRGILKKSFPNSYYMSNTFLINIRNKVETLKRDDTLLGDSFDELNTFLLPKKWMAELNDCLQEDMSPHNMHLDNIIELLENMDELSTYKLKKIFQLLAEKVRTFRFKMDSNEVGDFTGCCWQSGVMRGNKDLFGHYLSLDALRRELNDHHWSYLATTVKDDVNESQVCIECLAVGERKDTYRYLLKSLIEFTPCLDPSDVHVIASDAFLDQQFIVEFFPSSHYLIDRYDLLEAIKKKVTLVKWSVYEPLIYELINSKHAEAFEVALQRIQQLHTVDDELTEYFDTKSTLRSTFVHYEISEFPGNMGFLGSVISEQNNSNVPPHVDDVTTARSLDELDQLLLRRQREKELKTNARLMNQTLYMISEVRMNMSKVV